MINSLKREGFDMGFVYFSPLMAAKDQIFNVRFWVLFVLVKLMNFKLGTCLVLYVIYEIEIVFKFRYL